MFKNDKNAVCLVVALESQKEILKTNDDCKIRICISLLWKEIIEDLEEKVNSSCIRHNKDVCLRNKIDGKRRQARQMLKQSLFVRGGWLSFPSG